MTLASEKSRRAFSFYGTFAKLFRLYWCAGVNVCGTREEIDER